MNLCSCGNTHVWLLGISSFFVFLLSELHQFKTKRVRKTNFKELFMLLLLNQDIINKNTGLTFFFFFKSNSGFDHQVVFKLGFSAVMF